MKEAKIIVIHYPDSTAPQIIGGPLGEADTKHAAIMMNALAKDGLSEAWWAAPPIFWQRKLALALFWGAAVGALIGWAATSL